MDSGGDRIQHGGTVILCGNPNVGKSTLFNRLTGLRQHTGNWAGKTVDTAVGSLCCGGAAYRLVDLPGSYSLCSRSGEEEVARDQILFGDADLCVVVCDATCLSRGLVLALQVLELTGRVIVCVNLLDEAKAKGIRIHTKQLSEKLGVPVCAISSATGQGVVELVETITRKPCASRRAITLPAAVEDALGELRTYVSGQPLPSLWLARTLTEGDEGLCSALSQRLCLDPQKDSALCKLIEQTRKRLADLGYDSWDLGELAASAVETQAAEIAEKVLQVCPTRAAGRDRRLDAVMAHPVYGVPVMFGLLALVLWITIRGANIPSELLSRGLFSLGEMARHGLRNMELPPLLISALIDGVWRTTAWVVAVMLPPMAIFFPLFTVLEDLGYLPRVAFHLDGPLSRCGACGKQGLTMCMGLGCNAVGVTGCRIMESSRERIIAMVTNSFMPCNGRFPLLIALSGMFVRDPFRDLKAALFLAGILCLGVLCTCLASGLLGQWFGKNTTSSFVLELPPYRKPKIGQILLRSLRDRTVFVLGRALLVAAPSGLVIWLLANLWNGSVLQWLRGLLQPVGVFLGMDGAVLLAFILALPANEIVLPIALMIYTAGGVMVSCESLAQLGRILSANSWTTTTMLCVIVFTLLHWPCGTTLLTIRRETGSWKWVAVAAVLPTAFGIILCLLIRTFT